MEILNIFFFFIVDILLGIEDTFVFRLVNTFFDFVIEEVMVVRFFVREKEIINYK